ncbi:MAG TPA: LPS export ABC transporter permease LptG [Gammaproteobacteria bacterium]|nr:LPS export ABC transporter permease LptG [Gammaproteobacteria bacterium]
MKRIDLYLGRAVIAGALLAWAVVVSLDAVFAFLGEVGDIGRGSYVLADVLRYVALTLPARAYQSFPMAALIGALLGLGSLAAHGELDAMRLAGCSPLRLARAVLQAGVLLLLLAVLVGEGWAPGWQQLAGRLRTSAIFGDASVQTDSGFWVHDGERLIQVGEASADGSLQNLVVYELGRGTRLDSVTAVASATYRKGVWQLADVRSTLFEADATEVRLRPEARWPRLIDPRLARLLTRDAGTLSLPQLGRYIAYLEDNGGEVGIYRLRYWQRLLFPLTVFAMLLLALALVLGRLGRAGGGLRLLAAVVAGLLFKLLTDLVAQAGIVYGMPPWLSAGLPSLLVLLSGLWLLGGGHAAAGLHARTDA